jgi:opacity protein-like surface antigen
MSNPTALSKRLLAACALAVVAGCASVAYSPAALQTAATSPAPRALANPLDIEFDTGFHRTIAAGSQWQQVGAIAQGAVYKPHQDVFTLEGAHIHEAYLVVEQDKLVGFYLPAERGFSPLKRQLAINFK